MKQKTLSSETESIGLGIIIIIITVFAMAFADAIVKYVSSNLPLWQIYVVRSLVAIPIFTIILIFKRQPVQIAPINHGWVVLRSMLLTFMYIAIYAAAPILPLSIIAASLYTGPLFIALFSSFLIGERVGVKKWGAIFIGFLGVILIIKPATEAFTPLALIPVIAGLFYALAAIITRSKCRDEPPIVLATALNFSLLLVGLVATIIIIIWNPHPAETAVYPFLLGYWIPIGPREWGIITILAVLIVGISAGLAKAYQSAPPAIIATFDYTYLIFAAFFGFLIFAEIPDAITVIGMFLIAGAGLLVIRNET